MPNLDLSRLEKPSAFRKIAIGTWGPPVDPSVYGAINLRMDEALRYIEAFRAKTGRRLTLTHVMCRAIGAILEEVPQVNAIMRWGQIYERKDHLVNFQVVMKDPETGKVDLSMVTVDRANERPLMEIIDVFEANVEKVRKAEDKQLEGSRQLMKSLPGFAVGWMLYTLSFFMHTLNIDLSPAGLPKAPFGPIAVTNVGSLGLQEAYAPLVGYTRGTMVVALGALTREPIVDEHDNIVPASTMRVMATFDHRILDGAHAARMCNVLREWIEDPWTHFGPIPEPDAQAEGASVTPAEEPVIPAIPAEAEPAVAPEAESAAQGDEPAAEPSDEPEPA